MAVTGVYSSIELNNSDSSVLYFLEYWPFFSYVMIFFQIKGCFLMYSDVGAYCQKEVSVKVNFFYQELI